MTSKYLAINLEKLEGHQEVNRVAHMSDCSLLGKTPTTSAIPP